VSFVTFHMGGLPMWILQEGGGGGVNIIPREFKGQKTKGLQAPRVFGLGTSRGIIFTRIPRTSNWDPLAANIAHRENSVSVL
jgi:hypothetical protein